MKWRSLFLSESGLLDDLGGLLEDVAKFLESQNTILDAAIKAEAVMQAASLRYDAVTAAAIATAEALRAKVPYADAKAAAARVNVRSFYISPMTGTGIRVTQNKVPDVDTGTETLYGLKVAATSSAKWVGDTYEVQAREEVLGLSVEGTARLTKPNPSGGDILDGAIRGTRRPGGMYGLYKAIVESLFDAGDINRPLLRSDSSSAALVLVFGGDTVLSGIKASGVLHNIFHDIAPDPVDSLLLPIPKGTKVEPFPTQIAGIPMSFGRLAKEARHPDNVSGPDACGAYITLGMPFDIRGTVKGIIPFIPFADVYTMRAHVYVKRGGPITSAENIADYELTTIDLIKEVNDREEVSQAISSASGFGNFLSRVTGITRPETVYEGVFVSGLDTGAVYYIAVGYSYLLVDRSVRPTHAARRVEVKSTFSSLGAQIRYRNAEYAVARKSLQGTRPDWSSLSDVSAIVPGLRPARLLVEAYIDEKFEGLMRTATSIETVGSRALKHSERWAKRFAELSRRLQYIASLRDEFQALATRDRATDGRVGVWVTGFSVQGDATAFIKKLEDALLNSQPSPHSDGAPPFKSGDEYLGCVVLMVEGNTGADVELVYNLIRYLLGLKKTEEENELSPGERTAAGVRTVTEDPLADVTPPEGAVPRSSPLRPSTTYHNVGSDDDAC